MKQFEARKTRTGAVVAVGPARDIAAAVGTLVELVAPDGAVAYARLRSTGRAWVDPADPTGDARAYGYPDPSSITPAA